MKKIIGFALMLFSSMAFANVSVYDHAGVLSQAQQSALIAEGSRWPFDLHVLTDTFPNHATLDSQVHRCVNGPNVVCVGIDPTHHKTNVHVGTGVGIPSSEFSSIAAAGNSNFKVADYQGGIEAIAYRARDVAHTIVNVPAVSHNVAPYTVQPQVQVHIDNPVSTGMSTGWWLFLFFMIALAGLVIYYVRRAVKTAKKVNEDMNDFRDEAFEMSSRNMEERDFHEKLKTKLDTTTVKPMMPTATVPALTPAQPKVIVQQVAVATPAQTGTTVINNHYGTPGYPGYVGPNTTDMLLAYELGRISNPTPVIVAPSPVIVGREVVRETAPDDAGSSSSWDSNNNNDSGGSSSSWSSSDNDSSSSSDWGGSGGDSGGGDSGW